MPPLRHWRRVTRKPQVSLHLCVRSCMWMCLCVLCVSAFVRMCMYAMRIVPTAKMACRLDLRMAMAHHIGSSQGRQRPLRLFAGVPDGFDRLLRNRVVPRDPLAPGGAFTCRAQRNEVRPMIFPQTYYLRGEVPAGGPRARCICVRRRVRVRARICVRRTHVRARTRTHMRRARASTPMHVRNESRSGTYLRTRAGANARISNSNLGS